MTNDKKTLETIFYTCAAIVLVTIVTMGVFAANMFTPNSVSANAAYGMLLVLTVISVYGGYKVMNSIRNLND